MKVVVSSFATLDCNNSIIKEYLEIDLSDDFEFINGLKIHLFTLLNNTKDIRKYNTLTDKVKYKYPYIVEILRRILKNNGILSYNNIDDEDISFISLYIGTAIESKKDQLIKVNRF